jgi:MFS family permease
VISNFGTWLQNTAQVLIAYRLTGSPFMVGVVVSAQFAGTLLLSPWAAVLADRIGSRRTLIGAQCVSALTACWMAWQYHEHALGEWSLVAGALVLGLAFSLALPVQTALVPSLVPPSDAQAALAMNAVSYNAGRALAPALGVLVIAFAGPDLIFFLNAASFAVFVFILNGLDLKLDGESLQGHAEAERRERRRARVIDGLSAARYNRRILLLLAIVAAVTLADDPILVLSPGLAHTSLRVSSSWAGYFIAALGWGTVLGSVPPSARKQFKDPSEASRRAAWSLLWLAIFMVVFTSGLAAPVCLIAALAAGAAALFTGASTQALIVGTNPSTAASVAGLWAIAWAGTKPIASLLDGFLASHIGIWPTGIALALPAALLAFGELAMSDTAKQKFKHWSFSGHLQTSRLPDWITSRLIIFLRCLELGPSGVDRRASNDRAFDLALEAEAHPRDHERPRGAASLLFEWLR